MLIGKGADMMRIKKPLLLILYQLPGLPLAEGSRLEAFWLN